MPPDPDGEIMEKKEGRAVLKRLQAIVNFKGDEEADAVLAELRSELARIPSGNAERGKRGGRDREERGGRDRSEG